jgi:CelD/BcsL family acetyltransferase involved in cellulose biosynthesis
VHAEVIEDPARARALGPAWDELAVAAGAPFAAPGWCLPWWRCVAPPGAALAVVAVSDASGLVAVAPLWAGRGRTGTTTYRVLGTGASLRGTPIAAPGREREAAAAIAEALAGAPRPPDVLAFEGVAATDPWPALLRDAWPGRLRPWTHRVRSMPAPTLALEGTTYDAWLASRSRNFRSQLGRRRRQLEKAGATLRLASGADDVAASLRSFADLHHRRWEERGGSGVLDARVERMLDEAAAELAPAGRFRVWVLEVDGNPVSSQVLVGAGGELAYWLGGFDEAWASHQPALQTLVAAAEHAWAVGDRRLDLGAGGQSYKYRLADGEEVLEWRVLVPSGRRQPVALATMAPRHGTRAVVERVPQEWKDRVKRSLGRPVSG